MNEMSACGFLTYVFFIIAVGIKTLQTWTYIPLPNPHHTHTRTHYNIEVLFVLPVINVNVSRNVFILKF